MPKLKAGAVAARTKLYDDGFRPVVPLDDGVDLWANDSIVCAYRASGEIVALMTKFEYSLKRSKMHL